MAFAILRRQNETNEIATRLQYNYLNGYDSNTIECGDIPYNGYYCRGREPDEAGSTLPPETVLTKLFKNEKTKTFNGGVRSDIG